MLVKKYKFIIYIDIKCGLKFTESNWCLEISIKYKIQRPYWLNSLSRGEDYSQDNRLQRSFHKIYVNNP